MRFPTPRNTWRSTTPCRTGHKALRLGLLMGMWKYCTERRISGSCWMNQNPNPDGLAVSAESGARLGSASETNFKRCCMRLKMKTAGRSVVIAIIALFLLIGTRPAFAQQPKPKPVTPPPVVPGQKPPGAPAVPGQAGNAQPAASTDRALATGEDAVVQPFLDDNVLAVLRVDAASINLEQAKQWLTKSLSDDKADAEKTKLSAADVDRSFDQIKDRITRFTNAGGKRLYIVASVTDLPDHPPFIVVPLERGVDAANLIAVFTGDKKPGQANNNPNAIKINDSAIVAGDMTTLNRLKEAAASKPNSDLPKAFAAGEQAP